MSYINWAVNLNKMQRLEISDLKKKMDCSIYVAKSNALFSWCTYITCLSRSPGSLLPSSLKLLLWSPLIPDFLSQLPKSILLMLPKSPKLIQLLPKSQPPNPQISKINSAAPRIPPNLSQFSQKYIFLSLGASSHTHHIHDEHDLVYI